MIPSGRLPSFLWDIFQELRRRGFDLGIDDFLALRTAIAAGYGLTSRNGLRDLCVALWAKSREEGDLLGSLFDRARLPEWDAGVVAPEQTSDQLRALDAPTDVDEQLPSRRPTQEPVPTTAAAPSLPRLNSAGIPISDRGFLLRPIYPLTHREVAQAWRRLRQRVRTGPPVDLDIRATIDQRSRMGIATAPVVVPRRKNIARLLLLVDRQGSMAPFHPFVQDVTQSIVDAGALERVSVYYFHDVPAHGADTAILSRLADNISPVLDSALHEIAPLDEGYFYLDPECSRPIPIGEVLGAEEATDHAVVVGDGGAARGSYDLIRLLDTVAFFKALRDRIPHYAWLNPVPVGDWKGSTAAQLARHLPMFPLDREGMHRAVDVLRGQPVHLERPL